MKYLIMLFSLSVLMGCVSEADKVSANLSTDAEEFKITRRVIFYNTFQNVDILTISGRCSVESDATWQYVTCRIGETKYKKNMISKSDNTVIIAEQLEAMPASAYHYKVIFKPQSILSNIDFKWYEDGEEQ